jgi:Zn-dependent protease
MPPGDHGSQQTPPPWPSGPAGGNGRGGSGWRASTQGANRNRWILPVAILGAALLIALVRSHRISTTDIVVFCCIVPSIILHEISHGWVALAFGDDTAKRAGRLTLNPIAHVDLVGTIIVPAVLALGGYGAFGWAKPVPVNVGKLRSPRNQSLIVALAGPATNIVLAALSALAFTLAHGVYTLNFGRVNFVMVVFYLGLINLWLAMFNLIPIPPLDGSALLERAMPMKWWPGYLRLRQYAMPAVMVLVLLNLNMHPGPITWLFEQVERFWINVLIHLA